MSFQLDQLIVQFLKHLEKQGKTFNTLRNYKSDMNCFEKYFLETKKHFDFKGMSSSEVQTYAQFIQNKYPSNNTRRRRIQALRLFFDFLMIKKIMNENPIKKIVTSPKELKEPTPPTPKDVKKLFEILKADIEIADNELKILMAYRNYFICSLIFDCALKVSDLSTLEFSDFLPCKKKQFRLLIKSEKRDPYSVPVPLHISNELDSFFVLLKTYQDKKKMDFNQFLFNANLHAILSGGMGARGIELLFKKLNIVAKTKMTPRQLRQAGIINWLNQNHKPNLIKEWLGVAPSYSLKEYEGFMEKFKGEFIYY